MSEAHGCTETWSWSWGALARLEGEVCVHGKITKCWKLQIVGWVESLSSREKKSADCKSFKNCLPQLSDTKGLKAKILNLLTMRKEKKNRHSSCDWNGKAIIWLYFPAAAAVCLHTLSHALTGPAQSFLGPWQDFKSQTPHHTHTKRCITLQKEMLAIHFNNTV